MRSRATDALAYSLGIRPLDFIARRSDSSPARVLVSCRDWLGASDLRALAHKGQPSISQRLRSELNTAKYTQDTVLSRFHVMAGWLGTNDLRCMADKRQTLISKRLSEALILSSTFTQGIVSVAIWINVHTRTQIWHHSGASWSLLEPPGMSWSVLECPGVSWSVLEPPGASWNLLEPPGASWSLLEPPGSYWSLLEPGGTSRSLLAPSGAS